MAHLELVKRHSKELEFKTVESPVGRALEELCPTLILWAVDVDPSTVENAPIEKLYKEMAETRNVVVQPVHVLTAQNTVLPRRFFNSWSDELAKERAETIRSYYRQGGAVREAKILKAQDGYGNDGVGTLLEYADRVGADLIVAQSRQRNRFIRALRPGFTDELLERAKVPVLLFNTQLRELKVGLHLPAIAA